MFIDKIKSTWKQALLEPQKLFVKEIRNANLEEATKMIAAAGLFFAILYSILSPLAGVDYVTVIIGFPIISIIGWLISSAIYYLFARLLSGRGTYTQQSYLIALYQVPLVIIISISSLIPIVGSIVSILLSLYSLYLLTVAMRVAHRFSTGRAVLSWVIPIVVIVVIMMLFFTAFMFGTLVDNLMTSTP